MKVCAISDLHGYLPEIQPCDLLLICGDIVPLHIQTNMVESEKWLEEVFVPWINDLPIDRAVLIAGNHDFFMERCSQKAAVLLNSRKLAYLRNMYLDYVSTQGEIVTIFGTPYCKIFGNWAFMRDPDTLKEKYSEIPNRGDILSSHDAPKIGNVGAILEGRWAGEDAGNPYLAEEISFKVPRYCFCGHIHSGEHNITEYNDTKLANVSIMNESYEPLNEPLYVEIQSNRE